MRLSEATVEAVEIADKHLAGEPPERRVALAKDIVDAIGKHAERMAFDAIKTAAACRPKRHH